MRVRRQRRQMTRALMLVWTLALSSTALADDHFRGVVVGRGNDGTITVQTDDSRTVSVALKDATKIRRTVGMREIRMSSATLAPGLRVHVHGRFDGEDHFIADRVTFSTSSFKTATAIAAGVGPVDARSLANAQRIDEQARTLQRQGGAIETQKELIAANTDKILATSGALEATNARIANLDDYNVISTVTVYFDNGKASVAAKYRTELQQLAERARGVDGSLVHIQGFASAVGKAESNQQLSMRRAEAITAVLQQSGIAPTSVVVPAAMGTSQQVASNATRKGQAENRRAIVTLMQNRGISAK